MADSSYKVAQFLPDRLYYPSLLAYGPLGSGKTAFFGQVGTRGLYLDMDLGLRTLSTMDDQFKSLRLETLKDSKSFYEDNFSSPRQFGELKLHLSKLRTDLKTRPEKLIIVLDSFTGLIDAAIAYVLANSGHAGKAPTLPEWGVILMEVANFMRTFKSLPLIKVVCGHEMIKEVDETTTKIKLGCPGKNLPAQVAGFFDDVFYCTLRRKAGGLYDFTLTSRATTATECRTRSGFKDDYSMSDGLWPFLEKLGYIEKC